MDEKDRLLLANLHYGLPLVLHPFDAWAKKIKTDKADILIRLARFRQQTILSEIRAIFSEASIRHKSAWAAFKIPEKTISSEEFSDSLTKHPGIIYACERDLDWNVWIFLSVPAEQDLEWHAKYLAKILNAEKMVFFPIREVYKGKDPLTKVEKKSFFDETYPGDEKRIVNAASDLTIQEIEVLRALQDPLPLDDKPFQRIANLAGTTEEAVLTCIKALIQKGYVKKIGVIFKEAEAAEAKTVLVVWKIPEEKLAKVRDFFAGVSGLVYADRRPDYPEFPFGFWTLIRSETAEELELTIRKLQDMFGKWQHKVLATKREFKKSSIRYFDEGLDVWWRESKRLAELSHYDEVCKSFQ